MEHLIRKIVDSHDIKKNRETKRWQSTKELKICVMEYKRI